MSPRLQQFLSTCEATAFHGEVIAKFHAGELIGIEVKQSFKEHTLPAMPLRPRPPQERTMP